jgi:hypothetical protein
MDIVVRISALNLNNVKTALAHRSAILERSLRDNTPDIATKKEDHPFGEDFKMVRQCRLRPKLLTPAEKDDMVADTHMPFLRY